MGVYKYSYRFNAMHDTSANGDDLHVHSFEVVFFLRQEVKMFYESEKLINQYMEKYVGKNLNEVMEKRPIVENIAEQIFDEINGLRDEFEVIRLEISDSPVQTFILGVEEV